MHETDDIEIRVRQATTLACLLDAAYRAFEEMLTLIRAHDDPTTPRYVPMVLAGAHAANGRDWLGQAPSLPRSPFPLSALRRQAADPAPGQDADRIASLCATLADALAGPAAATASPRDQRACAGAARCAQDISDLVSERT